MKQVLVLGGVSFNTMIYLEHLPVAAPQSIWSKGYHETVGSTGAGKALNLGRLGLEVTLHALIGADAYGRRITDYFTNEPLTFLYDLDPAGTQRHVNLMDDQGRRISIFIVPGTYEPEVDVQRIAAAIPQSDYIVLNIANYCRHLIPLIKRHGKPIWCDIHDYDGANPYHQDFIDAADYLFLSSDALPDYRACMERLVGGGKQLVVCTHGRYGATALTAGGGWVEVPIVPEYPRVDSNGAGDSFFAGVLYGHAREYPIEQCLRLGAIVSGLCVTSRELAFPELSSALVEQEYQRHFGEERT
jgi:sugar/nucleoside kinase (ribokinase family)